MANIDGPLHAEAMGLADAPPMVFIHPNPMDSASWIFQMAHFSTWYRCIAIDLPGYGRSPAATAGLTMDDIAAACWEVVDRYCGQQETVLVGCSVGSTTVQHMYHLRPRQTSALVLTGCSWRPVKHYTTRSSAAYREHGIEYRYRYTLSDFSPEFARTPLARWFARLFTERNDRADLDTILTMFQALSPPDPEWLQADLRAPVLILSGSEDNAHGPAFALRDRLPDAELVTIEGAGHACYMEQPWLFDREMIRFLRALGHCGLPDPGPTR